MKTFSFCLFRERENRIFSVWKCIFCLHTLSLGSEMMPQAGLSPWDCVRAERRYQFPAPFEGALQSYPSQKDILQGSVFSCEPPLFCVCTWKQPGTLHLNSKPSLGHVGAHSPLRCNLCSISDSQYCVLSPDRLDAVFCIYVGCKGISELARGFGLTPGVQILTRPASATRVVCTWVIFPFSKRSFASKISCGFMP